MPNIGRKIRRRSSVAHFLELLESRYLLSGITLIPAVTATLQDQNSDGTADSIADLAAASASQQSFLENRGITEFSFASVAAPIDLAVLDFRLAGGYADSDAVRTFELTAYTGNGAAELGDFSSAGTVIHSVSYYAIQAERNFRLDVTDEVRSLIAAGATHFGLRIDAVEDGSSTGLYTPTLTINGAPAPSGHRSMESVPNAIRSDGVEAFRVEIDTHGEVAAVTLDVSGGFDIYFTTPGSGSLALRDDGLEGDRVAGDFIYTSGEIRFDTTKPFPEAFYQQNTDSPPGISIQEVGPVTITELDGTLSQFLDWPSVGLVRADIPDAPTQVLSSNVTVSDHVINVRTVSEATQSTIQGPSSTLSTITEPIYDVLPDSFDFLHLFSTERIETVPRLSGANYHAGVHSPVKVDYTGTGLPQFDMSASYGSAGRLQGINMLDAGSDGIWSLNVTHELVHQWSSYLDPSLGLTQGGGHPLPNSSIGSLVGGQQWIPNGDGSFTINFDEGRNGATHASPLDLYMMGLIDASELPDLYVYDPTISPPKSSSNPIVLASEIIRTVTAEDIIAVHGIRTPGTATAQRDFNIGFVAESHHRALNATEMTFYEIFAAHYTKPLPAGEPDPDVDGGWVSIANFFGHGTTWSSLIPGRTESTNQAPIANDLVLNVDENTFFHPVNGLVVGTVTGVDPEGLPLTFAIESVNQDYTFLIDQMTGELKLFRALDREARSEYTYRVVVADVGIPSQFDSALVTIHINDVNDNAPTISAGQSFSVSEAATNGTDLGSVVIADLDIVGSPNFTISSGNADGAFSINSATGQITVADRTRLDYETASSRTLSIAYSDGLFTAAAQDIVIQISDANEGPTIPNQAFSVNENSSIGSVVGIVTAQDPDAGQTLTFAITSGNSNEAFAINAATGQITVNNAAAMNYETTPTYALVVQVSDNGSPSLNSTATVTISLLNVNEAPTISGQTFSINENSANGTVVGIVSASDPDAGQSLTYSIASGNTSGAFTINATTGRITVASTAALDFETTPSFALQVSVTDNGVPVQSSSATITINLINLVEPLPITIDVVPGDSSNTVRINGKYEVAILSTASFDARQVNVNTVRFGKLGTEDSVTKDKKGARIYSYRDVNGDGRIDLVVQITGSSTGLALGDTLARLTASLTSGQSINGSSNVNVRR